MSARFTQADLDAIASTVERFCKSSLAPACERPERILTSDELAALTAEAVELGLLNASADEAFGLWEHADDASARALSLRTLRELARVNAGVAFHLHGIALGRFLLRALRSRHQEETVVCLQGAWGLGRGALPRLLRGGRLDEDESSFLADYFGSDEPRELLLTAADSWRRLIVPTFDAKSQQLGFSTYARDALVVHRFSHGHGLDEVTTYAFTPATAQAQPERVGTSGEQAREPYAAALCLHALGLLAIGVGALGRACGMARDYAGLRTQGGSKIDRHPAVQELLGKAQATAGLAQAALDGLGSRAPCAQSLPQILAVRAEIHPLLCAGANDALQVFGGLGYMRDTGLEKLVRDQNSLRVLGGTPAELRRFVAEWERP